MIVVAVGGRWRNTIAPQRESEYPDMIKHYYPGV